MNNNIGSDPEEDLFDGAAVPRPSDESSSSDSLFADDAADGGDGSDHSHPSIDDELVDDFPNGIQFDWSYLGGGAISNGYVIPHHLLHGPDDPMTRMAQLYAQDIFLSRCRGQFEMLCAQTPPSRTLNFQRRAICWLVACMNISDDPIVSERNFDEIGDAIQEYTDWDVILGVPVEEIATQVFEHVRRTSLGMRVQDGNPFWSTWSLRRLKLKFLSLAYACIRSAVDSTNDPYTRALWTNIREVVMKIVRFFNVHDSAFFFIDN